MVAALILSGGTGTRMGVDTPKQYLKINDRPVISYCIERLLTHEGIDAVQIVADELWRDEILNLMERIVAGGRDRNTSEKAVRGIEKFHGFSAPGKTRQLSILNGLKDIRKYAADGDHVLIHDAARPLLSEKQITDCLDAIEGHDGVLPVLPMKDTVYASEDGRRITSLLNRSRVYAGQAPELFVLGKYYAANKALLPERILQINGSTEPAVMAGMDIAMIPGDERNFKITTRADLERFREIVSAPAVRE